MRAWQTSYEYGDPALTHTLHTESGRSLVAVASAGMLQPLRVSISLYNGKHWWSLYAIPSVALFEQEYGVETARWEYNGRQFEKVLATKRAIRGEHAGYSDLFAPVVVDGVVESIVVLGPVATARPTGAQIKARWRDLTGREADPTDLEFSSYLRATLDLLLVEGPNLTRLEHLLTCFAQLLGTARAPARLASRADALARKLRELRRVDEVWEAARSFVEERSALTHYSPVGSLHLTELGLSRAANQVLVGFCTPRGAHVDPVDDALRRDALQRATVAIAREAGDALCGRAGDHGIVFFYAAPRSAQQAKSKLNRLVDRTARVGRELGLSLHFGLSSTAGSKPLGRCYYEAAGAAESALSRDSRLVVARSDQIDAREALRALRRELDRDLAAAPDRVPAHFDRYSEAVTLLCGQRLDLALAHLDFGFDRVADTLVSGGLLDARSLSSLRRDIDEVARQSRSTRDLVAAFQRGIVDLVEAAKSPVVARRSRGVRAALELIEQRYGEPLTLEQAARAAGFAPKYFSTLFHRQQHVTFERYLTRFRLERAKQLLSGTDLSATRVAELSGFRSPQYLSHVFRRELGATPIEFRMGKLPDWARPKTRRKQNLTTRQSRNRTDRVG